MPTPPPPPPEDLEQQAEQARSAAELAALALFVAVAAEGGGEPNSADAALVRRIFADLVKAISLGALASAGGWAGQEVESVGALSTTVNRIAENLSQPNSPQVRELIAMVRKIRQANRDAPPRDPGELSLPRESARNFATWAYGKAIEAAAPLLSEAKPEWLAKNMTLKKTWITQGDSRVRPLHRRLHARTRNWDQDFWRWPTTGQKLRYPGDPSAPLDAVIGCRCLCWLSWSKPGELSATIRDLPPFEDLPRNP